ncbi:MAG TPA: hypothetical protein VG078_10685 [Acidimicrobiales bacterium]|jgi:hypothetical protein|nr:hypothetical protein [Acidimicrobiales bacterium]
MELLLLLLIVFLVAAAVGGLGRGYYRRPRRPIYDDEVVYDEPVPRRRRFF